MPLCDWKEVEAIAEAIMDVSVEPFDAETIANARDLLTICRGCCPVPVDVAKGYWSTLCLVWDKFELEVFGDRVEVCHLEQPQLQVWYEQHIPGQDFSLRFFAELPKVSGGTGIA
jgi:hypothetical protein